MQIVTHYNVLVITGWSPAVVMQQTYKKINKSKRIRLKWFHQVLQFIFYFTMQQRMQKRMLFCRPYEKIADCSYYSGKLEYKYINFQMKYIVTN